MAEFLFEGSTIGVEGRETVLDALLRSGHEVPHKCKSGVCQQCTLRVKSGDVSDGQKGLDDSLVELGYFLSCQTPGAEVQEVSLPSEEDFPKYNASVSGSRKLSEDVLLLTLCVPNFPGGAGRFVRLTHPGGITRQYSIATPAWESTENIQLHIRLIPNGEMSSVLMSTQPGDAFVVEGPLGKCRYRSQTGTEPMLLICSGTGLAPLYAIITEAIEQNHQGPINLYHGAATPERLYFESELGALAENANVHQCVESNACEKHREGSPLAAALADHPNLDGYHVYLCGHPDLIKNAQKQTFLAGASMKDIVADPFVAS